MYFDSPSSLHLLCVVVHKFWFLFSFSKYVIEVFLVLVATDIFLVLSDFFSSFLDVSITVRVPSFPHCQFLFLILCLSHRQMTTC